MGSWLARSLVKKTMAVVELSVVALTEVGARGPLTRRTFFVKPVYTYCPLKRLLLIYFSRKATLVEILSRQNIKYANFRTVFVQIKAMKMFFSDWYDYIRVFERQILACYFMKFCLLV